MREIIRFVEEIHILTANKGRLFRGPSDLLPINGIYVFFEAGQKILINSKEYNRIVRIGINERPNNFRSRIRGHYHGNIEGSVFRENVGWALLESKGKRPMERFRTKREYKKQNSSGPLEKEISDYFSKFLTFKAFQITYSKLEDYERIMIGAFSIYYQYKILKKELDLSNWLGLYTYSQQDKIKRSGLWNSEGVILLTETSLGDYSGYGFNSISEKFDAILMDLTRNIT
ncbi:MAG: hypothetical protein N3D12_05800 [Candidatus Methanomethyliaceae archaeon]|nr:hypothetical protein [Candidatus Methanomethyliaceae archaeon]